MDNDQKRLFFGAEVVAPWPKKLPKGRILAKQYRHVTLAFLGNTPSQQVEALLTSFSPPPFRVGIVGNFDRCLCLPEKNPSVITWHVDWLGDIRFEEYQWHLVQWLRHQGYILDKRPFVSHVTLSRKPFVIKEWERSFCELPMMITAIHLYESVGSLTYQPLKTYELQPPFEKKGSVIRIYGETPQQLQHNAGRAVAFYDTVLGEEGDIITEDGLMYVEREIV